MSAEVNANKVTVIAPFGYTALLDICGSTLPIDSYTPVCLSDQFSAEEIEHSASLKANIANGFLKFYAGEPLPVDPNVHSVKRLTESPVARISSNFKTGSSANAAAPPIKVDISQDFINSLSDRVDANSKRVTADLQKVDDMEDEDEDPEEMMIGSSVPSASNFLGEPVEAASLVKPVVMDVSKEKFDLKQNENKPAPVVVAGSDDKK